MPDYIDKYSDGSTTYDLRDSGAREEIAALDENKANIDGYYEQMTVGNAEQLVATVGVEDKAPYNFRTAGGSADIGDRLVEKVVGGTVAWNQQAQNWKITGQTSVPTNTQIALSSNATVDEPSKIGVVNHKYLVSMDYYTSADFDATAKWWLYFLSSSIAVNLNLSTANKNVAKVIPCERAQTLNVIVTNYVAGTLYIQNLQVFDLTQMFGSTIADYIYSLETANAGAGVAWFRKLFPKPYYAYNAGELMSVQAASHKTVGFNQWDGVSENGRIDTSTGQDSAVTGNRSKNYVRVIPNVQYYVYSPQNKKVYVICYGADKSYVCYDTYFNNEVAVFGRSRGLADKVYYIRFYSTDADGLAGVCINLSWDGERDGEYEPYALHEYPLDSSLTLRGIPKLDANNELYYDGDEYESDGTVTRKYIQYTITGNETVYAWGNTGYGTHYGGALVLPDEYKNIIAFADNMKGMATKGYQVKYANEDRTIYASTATRFSIIDDRYTTQETWLAGITGTTILFLLSTPTTESADPYQNPQIVDDFGTEEYVDAGVTATTPTRDVAIPVGHVSKYQANLRAKLEMAPNSPNGDGDYIVRQTNGQNEYVALTFPADELPAAPTDNGTYTLKCTVSGSGTTYAWVADT